MAAAYRAGMAAVQHAVQSGKAQRFSWFPAWQFAMAAGLLVGGILLGRYLPQAGGGNPEMAQLRSQVENLHQMVALSMLQQQSPSARMRGVTYSEKFAQPDPQVLDALLQAGNHDANVNARPSPGEPLSKYGCHPRQRSG